MTEWEQLDIYGNAVKMPAASRGRLTMIATRMSEAETRAIKGEAQRRKCSVSSIVREALQDWLKRNLRAR